MKRIALVMMVVLMASSSVWADPAGYIPTDGLTGLWRFQDSTNKLQATFGTDITTSNPDNSGWMPGPWTMIGIPGNAGALADGGCVQERAWDYLTVTHNIAPNGGGAYVNQYTIAIDYVQTSGVGASWNSLYQTGAPHGNDGDLFITPDNTIGIGAVGYSTSTFNPSSWHRIIWSVDNGDNTGAGGFFKVFVDGELFLNGAGQGRDGRFSLDPQVYLFADDSWEDQWGLVGTAMTWGRALNDAEITQMGGWIGGSATPTALMVPEPSTFALLAAGLAMFFVIRKKK